MGYKTHTFDWLQNQPQITGMGNTCEFFLKTSMLVCLDKLTKSIYYIPFWRIAQTSDEGHVSFSQASDAL